MAIAALLLFVIAIAVAVLAGNQKNYSSPFEDPDILEALKPSQRNQD